MFVLVVTLVMLSFPIIIILSVDKMMNVSATTAVDDYLVYNVLLATLKGSLIIVGSGSVKGIQVADQTVAVSS